MPTIGKLEPFNLNSKQWPAYIRRVKQYILLNEVKSELTVPLLITVVGEATYALMCDLCAPSFPETKTFEELVKLVTEHLEPQRSEVAERHVFRLRRQRVGEPLSEYLQALKHLASTCNFGKCGSCSTLEENLRDQFVSGLTNDAMRSRIFAEKKIEYKAAVELALALEAAEKHAEVSASTHSAGATGATADTSGASSAAAERLHYARGRRGAGAGPGGSAGAGAHAAAAVQAVGAPSATSGGLRSCWRCGKAHPADRCRFKNYSCDECGQKGHLKVKCKNVRVSGGRQNYVSDSEEDLFNLDSAESTGIEPYFIKVSIDNIIVQCEVDTGSRISAISEQMYSQLFSHKEIKTDNLILRSYSGARIKSLGFIEVEVELETKKAALRLYIIKGGARPLLGREWMHALEMRQIYLNEIMSDGFVNQLCKEFPEVFSEKLGTCKRAIRLQLTDQEPVYVRARLVPLALRERVERELARLEADGSIYRLDYSDYGTPIVPVVKKNGDIRICGDYKITINPKLKRDYYPLPRIEELFATLSGGKKFSKIDLKHAFEQCLITEDSQLYTAITTHIGTFAYRRTPYGLSCIPEKFQKIMEETLRGIPGCVVFCDDICVTGPNDSQNIKNLKAVLGRLRDAGLTIKLNKCKFLQDSVRYVGFIINKEGLKPDPEKLEAISNAPHPQNISQLKSFLGMLNYYGRFIRNLSTLLHPLHNLLKKEVSWEWDSRCEDAFKRAKCALLSSNVLAHYEEGRPLVLSVDSSAYGLGAVLAHRYEDGSERPVSCVSRTLSAPERNYSQLDKEALAILFGVSKHHQYLFGRMFTLRTDHQPLTHIFGKKGGIPQTAASRLQRWAARLAAYDFSIEFVKSADNGPADALSRLPLDREGRTEEDTLDYLNLVEDVIPVSFKDVARESERDSVLNKIKGYVLFGWPAAPSSEAEKPYYARQMDICVDRGCLIYKYRIIIPRTLQKSILNEIHESHLGMNKMKNLSRNYVYWPSLDQDIEDTCRACEACQVVRDAPPRAQLHPWEFPLNPWQRVHADFGDMAGVRYLIIVDAHSKWIEALPMRGTEARSTINAFRGIFARFGLPTQLVTDNGPPFSSLEFKEFCEKNCIKHITSAPYRPQANGAAENAVKIIKKVIKRAQYEGDDINAAISKFLLKYRNCPHATTGVSPAVALQGRRLRSRLDALRPDVGAVVRAAQERQIRNGPTANREFKVGDAVLARDYTVRGEKWAPGTVSKKTGPVSYNVDVGNDTQWRRHADQIIAAGSKNRFSLARTSTQGQEDTEPNVDRVDPPPSPDGDDQQTREEQTSSPREASTRSPPSQRPAEATLETRSPSPPPDVSARALRALKRAKRTFIQLLE